MRHEEKSLFLARKKRATAMRWKKIWRDFVMQRKDWFERQTKCWGKYKEEFVIFWLK